ncbi:DUF551 domain-containing protein [Enterobacter hormaechei]|uniref:DUF551 domain-containing protein n=1 Tax=Enterobacter hormaechei TaxID=158836 RepID=UPI000735401D|nr:DUF551 domain-containing protein [Enterobacter hormaechei]AWX03736.1 DUF551 domain-containing protein [Enterobacter hormaechei]KTI18537.1 hypothetical protein ASV10_22625 [Enterobacter hormaechei subsp. xiangfangensis]KTJ15447.1 hypothetical protein ASU90_21650 [Enterobacter hormaechei subsp. xiangfangensis]MBN7886478.1 DUF551 domain-containing protein [Enterobacter hormaechei]MCK1034003.1 DUF551 domain-containing protein [Enterobacter hormaechei subsp. xiangfangensis]
MSTTLKEWLLKTIAELEEERDAVPGIVNEDAAMALAAMKLALASLEADVVAWTDEQELRDVEKYGCGYLFTANPVTPNADPHRVIKLYAAPPAPVSVPDEIRLLQSEVTIWKDRWELLRELFREVADALGCDLKDNQAMLDKIEMLQGAEPVSNRDELPDGWVACSERMPETAGNYWGWWSESKRQGPVWFIKSELQAQFQSSEITHWMPLPAAPQQEVK